MPALSKFDEVHFDVALSFPGEKRGYVEQVAEALGEKLTRESIFYDNWYQPHLARLNLDLILQDIYHNRSRLLIVFLCEEYERKEWCGIEWRAIRDLIKQRREADIMLVRLDEATLSGVLSIDGYLDARGQPPSFVAKSIIERLTGTRFELPSIDQDTGFVAKPRRGAPYIICALPRGVLLIEDASPRLDPNWFMTANYYQFGEGWRYGTHYHPSYWNSWQNSDAMENQCQKVQIPKSDRTYCHWPFHMIAQLGEAKSHDEAASIVDDYCSSESAARLYLESDTPDPTIFTKPYQALKRTGALRDIREEIVTWRENPAMRWGKTDQFAFSIAFRILNELSRHLNPTGHSFVMLAGLLQQRDHKTTTDFMQWLDMVDVALIDSIAIISEQTKESRRPQ